jgi:hypothetical protein
MACLFCFVVSLEGCRKSAWGNAPGIGHSQHHVLKGRWKCRSVPSCLPAQEIFCTPNLPLAWQANFRWSLRDDESSDGDFRISGRIFYAE